jgi:8-oxo-dGTP diphosphatase
MKKFLLKIWRILPFWMQGMAAAILRPRHQVAVGALIFNEQGQLLLCEHTYRRVHPWGLPGGDLKLGEEPVDGIKREVFEETGLSVQDAHLLLAENSTGTRHITLVYLCTGVSGYFVSSDEVSSIRYFDTDNLPDFFEEQGQTIERSLALLKSEKNR